LAYLPNKKILGLIVLTLIIFGGWFYFSKQKNNQINYENEKAEPLVVARAQNSDFELDSDGDGLKDWEELLWKTDPKKADTDGDGATDNEEIAQNRDPLKPGPDDKISKMEDLVAASERKTEEEQTVTAGYAKKFLSAYLMLKREKGELTAEDKQDLVESFMENVGTIQSPDKYKVSDLKTIPSVASNIAGYAETMKKLFITDTQDLTDITKLYNNFLAFLYDESSDGDGSISDYVDAFSLAADNYKNTGKTLLALQVPDGAKNAHLEVVNAFNNISQALMIMAEAHRDPIKAMMGQKLYDEQMQRGYDALLLIQDFFDEYEIVVFE